MPNPQSPILVTGASGKLGRLIIARLLERVPADHVIAMVRAPEAGADFAGRGVQVRVADYNDPAALDAALAGVATLMFVSSSEVGARIAQHRHVIDAAARAGVGLVVYTSILHADTTPLGLGTEHRATEAMLRASGLRFVLLRNGYYTENYTGTAPVAVAHGAVVGSAGDGRLSTAAHADYAAAAVAVLTAADDPAGRTYELAGDDAYTLAEYAAELARQSGTPVVYTDLPEAQYKAVLVNVGLPESLAGVLADGDVGASKGGLFDDGRALSRLIGRPTTPLAASISAALRPRNVAAA